MKKRKNQNTQTSGEIIENINGARLIKIRHVIYAYILKAKLLDQRQTVLAYLGWQIQILVLKGNFNLILHDSTPESCLYVMVIVLVE